MIGTWKIYDVRINLAHALEHLQKLRLGAHHIKPVAGLGHKVTVGDDILALMLGSAEEHLGNALAVKGAQRNAGG